MKTSLLCKIEGCSSAEHSKGYCTLHYDRTPERVAYKKARYLLRREAHLAKQREWYWTTLPYQKERSKKYREENPEEYKARHRKAYWSDLPKQREKYRRYYPGHKQDYTARTALRRTRLMQRTPAWTDLDAIKAFYKNCPPGYHVDHIIPLQGKNVSGLHVLENLQYLPAAENLSKGNRYG